MSYWQAIRSRYAVTADPLRTQRRIELVAVSLGAVILLQLVIGFSRLVLMTGPAALEPSEDSLRVPAVAAPPVVAAADRNEIITRPLFWVGRRPLEAVNVVAEPDGKGGGAAELDKVTLVGVFGGGDTAGVIVLVDGKKRRILLDEELDGWILKSIEGGKGVFARGPRRETLELQRVDLGLVAAPVRAARPDPRQKAGEKKLAERAKKDKATTGGSVADKAPADADKGGPALGEKAEPGLSLGPGAR